MEEASLMLGMRQTNNVQQHRGLPNMMYKNSNSGEVNMKHSFSSESDAFVLKSNLLKFVLEFEQSLSWPQNEERTKRLSEIES